MFENMAFLVFIWLVVCLIMVLRNWKSSRVNSGIVIFYVATISSIHLLGPIVFLLPWYDSPKYWSTLLGFEQATYSIIGFFGGYLLISFFTDRIMRRKSLQSYDLDPERLSRNSLMFSKIPLIYLLSGLGLFGLMGTVLGGLSTVRSILSIGPVLMTAATCVACYQALKEQEGVRLKRWLLFAGTFPFLSVITTGFFGLGAYMTLRVFLFVSRFVKNKKKIILFGLIFAYLGLSFFQVYMRDRRELREIVWGGGSVGAAAAQFSKSFMNFEFFNPLNNRHLDVINSRLNQNILVGAAVRYLDSTDKFARGETLWYAVIALVPRAIWAEKPITAGGSKLVTQYTGVKFDKQTSVGLGLVMEQYINFGTIGVLLGFFVIGAVVTFIDFWAGYHLLTENYSKFVVWFLPGLAILNIEGTLFEVSATAAASLIVGILSSKYHGFALKYIKIIIPFVVLMAAVYITGNAIPWIYPYLKKILLVLLGLLALRILVVPFFKSRPTGNR